MRQCPHQQIPGIHAVWLFALRAEVFGGIELRLDRRNDRVCDLVLDSEHVGKIAVIALGPDVPAGDDVIELRSNANAIAVLSHAAFDHVADPKFFADLLEVDGLAFVCE
jgi:hypothetical protein